MAHKSCDVPRAGAVAAHVNLMQPKVGIASRHFTKKRIGFVNTWPPPLNVLLDPFTGVFIITGSIGLFTMRRRRSTRPSRGTDS